ncbi:hypothetical protein [Kibdelosporangium aridum]|nr:hypothetical protein [Kibdelosporangium aridum]
MAEVSRRTVLGNTLDMHTLAGNAQALAVLTGMAAWRSGATTGSP